MSKLAAIDFAVRQQLAEDGKNPPAQYKEVLGPDPGGGIPFYNYSTTSIPTFLFKLARRLRQDEPALDFPWADQDFAKCLQLNLAAFEDLVARKTVIIQK